MVEVVPAGQQGVAKVDHVVVDEDAARWASVRGELLSPGPLARLLVNGQLMMSDGSMEHTTNHLAVRDAHGDVLVAGLGLGMVLIPMLRSPAVRTITVIEKYRDVIELVERPLRRYCRRQSRKLTIIEANAYDWQPPGRQVWDCIYFDVWPSICTDNLKTIAKLKRRYARRLNRQNPRAWMRAWVEELLRTQRRRDQDRDRMYRSYEPGFRCGTFR